MERSRSLASNRCELWRIEKIHNDGDMNPALLDNKELRRDFMGGYYKMMKKIAEILNQNLVRNSDVYLYSGGFFSIGVLIFRLELG